MMRTPADIIAAAKAAYRPDAPAGLELTPGDHDAIAKLEKMEGWLATVRRWLEQDREAARAFSSFRANLRRANLRTREKGGAA